MDKKTEIANELFIESILSLKTKDEVQKFFDDMCTPKETRLIAQRLYVAKLLRENKVYSEIVEETGASSATVSRVKRTYEQDREFFDLILERNNNE